MRAQSLASADQRLGPEQMHCMEVWGGNTAIDKWFKLPGLNAWVFSDPHDNTTLAQLHSGEETGGPDRESG